MNDYMRRLLKVSDRGTVRWVQNRLEPLTDQQITDLARDVVTNRVFLTNNWEKARLSFMVLSLADPQQIPWNIGAVYEHYDKAGPMAVNGQPLFFSARFVAQESVDALADKIDQMHVALGLGGADR